MYYTVRITLTISQVKFSVANEEIVFIKEVYIVEMISWSNFFCFFQIFLDFVEYLINLFEELLFISKKYFSLF